MIIKSRKIEDLNDVFRCLLRLYYPTFKNYIRNIFPNANEDDLWDSFTEAFIRLRLKIKNDQYKEKGVLTQTLLFSIAIMFFYSMYQKRSRTKTDFFEDLNELGFINDSQEDFIFKAELQFEANERLEALKKAWPLLGERCQNLIIWRKIKKYSEEETAKRTGLSTSSINNEVYKCFLKLKRLTRNEQ